MISHDIGIMVAYAYAALYPDNVERLVVMDAPIPGIAPWDDMVRNPVLWHFLSMERMPSAWWRGANEFIGTASGTPSPAIPLSPISLLRPS